MAQVKSHQAAKRSIPEENRKIPKEESRRRVEEGEREHESHGEHCLPRMERKENRASQTQEEDRAYGTPQGET